VTPGTPAAEISWLERYPDVSPETHYVARESVELAFVAALQHLSALQRAVLILRDVLGFSAAEVSEQLDTSTAAVNTALQRARQAIASTAPTQQTMLRNLGDAAVNDILTRWIDAWQAGDVNKIVAMLADDACYSTPPRRTFPAVSTSSLCSTDAWQRSSPSSMPTSPDSGCRIASARRRVQNWATGALVAATRSSGGQRHGRRYARHGLMKSHDKSHHCDESSLPLAGPLHERQERDLKRQIKTLLVDRRTGGAEQSPTRTRCGISRGPGGLHRHPCFHLHFTPTTPRG
jgi:Sigma-70, region 4